MTIAAGVVLQVLLMRAAGRLKVKINTPPPSSYTEGEMSIFIHPNDLCNLKTDIPNLLRNADITTFLFKLALASSTAKTAAVAIGATHALATEGASKTKHKIVDKILWKDESSVLARETHMMVKQLHNHFYGLGLKLNTKRTVKNGKNKNGANGKRNGDMENGNGGNGDGDGDGDDHSSADNGGNGGSGGLLNQIVEIMKEMGRKRLK